MEPDKNLGTSRSVCTHDKTFVLQSFKRNDGLGITKVKKDDHKGHHSKRSKRQDHQIPRVFCTLRSSSAAKTITHPSFSHSLIITLSLMMMIFIGTLFCNLHRDANGLHLRQIFW